MSDTEKTIENEVTDLKENLKEMPRNLRFFSQSLRSLYAKNDVGTSTDVSGKFRKLRDDTRQDAILYLKCHLPISTKFVSSIKEYFEYYENLDYKEWCEMLPDIREETRTYKEFAQTLLGWHEKLMISLKKREDEAKIIMTEFKDLQSAFEEQKEILEATAKSNMNWAVALFFVPGVNYFACPYYTSLAFEDIVKAIAKSDQADVHGVAALVVATTLIPALSHFIDGLKKAAGFFQVMEKELQSFEDKARKNIKSPKQLHYKVMSRGAKEMITLCQAFYAVLPDVRTDFEAIPMEGTDLNYVDKWMEKELAQIDGKRSKVHKFLSAILRGSEAEGKEKAEGEEKAEGDREKAEGKEKAEGDRQTAEGEEEAEGDRQTAEGEEEAENDETFFRKTWRMVVAYANNCCICK